MNVSDKTSTVVFPTPDTEQRLDAEAYPVCPGPFDLANLDISRVHGLYQGSTWSRARTTSILVALPIRP